MAAVAYGSVPFSEQIRFFRNKRDVLTESWLDVYGAEHDVSFMVAGANRDDMLADFRQAIDKAIAEGATLADFRKDFDRIVEQYGWDYTGGRNWRSRIIYETNLRQSYNAGRWEQLQRLKRARPYWRYRHSDAVQHPRPIHESWDGLVLHADDEWWHTYFPANGWGCQCYVEALNERDLRRMGKSGPDQAPPIEWEERLIGQRSPGGPRLVRVPRGIDPGFAYAPGRSLAGAPVPPIPRTPRSLASSIERTAQMAIEKSTQLPAMPSAAHIEQLLELERVRAAIDEGYAQWRRAMTAADTGIVRAYFVGGVDRRTVQAMTASSAEPGTAAIAVRELPGAVAPASLAAHLREADAVLLDASTRTLIYVVRRERLAISVSYQSAGTAAANEVRGVDALDASALRAQLADGTLQLLRGEIR